MFKFPVQILHLLLIISPSFASKTSDDYLPSRIRWVNSLNNGDQIKNFLNGNAKFAREYVNICDDNGKPVPYLGAGCKQKLTQALYRLNASKQRRDRQLMLIFESTSDYIQSIQVMDKNRADWIWIFFNVYCAAGATKSCIDINNFKPEHLLTMSKHSFAFGSASDRSFGGNAAYEQRELSLLASYANAWNDTVVRLNGDFMIEVSMHRLLESKAPEESMKYWANNYTMKVCFATVKEFAKDVAKKKDLMKAVATLFEKKRVYFNIPDSLRKELQPAGWWGDKDDSDGDDSAGSLTRPLGPIFLFCLAVFGLLLKGNEDLSERCGGK